MPIEIAKWCALAIVIAAVVAVGWSRRQSYAGSINSCRVVWLPDNELHVAISHGVNVRKPYRTLRVHEVRTSFSSIYLPEGFEFDGASIPRWLKPFIRTLDPWERYEIPAAIHDLLYSVQKSSRFSADALFRDLMASCGVPMPARLSIYYAVRLFGGKAWKENQDALRRAGFEAQQRVAAASLGSGERLREV